MDALLNYRSTQLINMYRDSHRRLKRGRRKCHGTDTTIPGAAVVMGLALSTPTCGAWVVKPPAPCAGNRAAQANRRGCFPACPLDHTVNKSLRRGAIQLRAAHEEDAEAGGGDSDGTNKVEGGNHSTDSTALEAWSSSADSLLHFFPRAASSVPPADPRIGTDAPVSTKSPSHVRRRSKAKIKATPVVSSMADGDRDGGGLRGVVRRVWGFPGAVCDVVLGRPTRFVRRRVEACRIFLVTRQRIHWLSFGMAAYIATTTIAPRMDNCRRSGGGQLRTGKADGSNVVANEGDHTFSVHTRRDRRRDASVDDNRNDNLEHIEHLDDHAAGLWRDSAIARAAGASTPTTATSGGADRSVGGESADNTNAASPDTEDHRAIAEEKESAPPDELHPEAFGDAALLEDELTGIIGGSSGPGEVAPDLRTHTDLGDLELAAEKALDWAPTTEPQSEKEKDQIDKNMKGVGDEVGVGASVNGDDDRIGSNGDEMQDAEEGGGEEASASSPTQGGPGADTESEAATRTASKPASQDDQEDQPGSTPRSVEGKDETVPPLTEEAERSEERIGNAWAEGELVAAGAAAAEEVGIPMPGIPRAPTRKAPTGSAGLTPGGASAVPQASGGERLSSSFVATAARAVSPAVCRIDMERLPATSDDTPFPDVEFGQGSGVIFSSDEGLVLTNAHVVDSARKVTVTLTDGRKFLAEVKGADELSDLAVLKIDKSDIIDQTPLPAATLGNSQELQVGDWVIAVGNPIGLDSTVTLGIISSLKRSSEQVGFPERKVTFIQTDAAINPGNSGGPLVNEFGEVVGINTAIRAGAEGIGFAIPINKAKAIMQELADGKRIEYAYIGIEMTAITPDYAKQNNRDPNSHHLIPEVYGPMITRVLPETPAASAGLRRYDVIIEMNGRRVLNPDDTKQVVDEANVDDILEVKVMRGVDRIVDLEVQAKDLEEHVKSSKPDTTENPNKDGPDGGKGGGKPDAPRPEPKPYPGEPPPAFPWGSSSPRTVPPTPKKTPPQRGPQENGGRVEGKMEGDVLKAEEDVKGGGEGVGDLSDGQLNRQRDEGGDGELGIGSGARPEALDDDQKSKGDKKGDVEAEVHAGEGSTVEYKDLTTVCAERNGERTLSWSAGDDVIREDGIAVVLSVGAGSRSS